MTPRVSLALLVLALFSANQPSARAAAQMSNPVPGSTFSSSSVTFNWTAGSATNYALLVGSSLYGHDIYSSGVINALSATVNNIPTDGRTIYVTLASNVSGSWTSNNYTYTAVTSSATPTPTATPAPTATPIPTPVPISTPAPGTPDPLTIADVQTIINHAVTRAVRISPNSVIAVTDREGYVLGVWVVRGGAATPGEIATAVSKAGTAAYLSSNQNAFTSRTAGFIIQQHLSPTLITSKRSTWCTVRRRIRLRSFRLPGLLAHRSLLHRWMALLAAFRSTRTGSFSVE